MIRNLLNSLSHERSQTDYRLRKHPSSALTDSGSVDQGSLDLGSDSSVAAAPVQGIGQATATTTLPRILPPPGGPISPVNALAVTAETSGTAAAAPLTSTATDTLFGNAADTPVAGSPNATLVGGPGSDTFVVGPGGGQETIQNFDPQHDTLQFGALFANYAAAMTDARQVGTGTVFTLDAHDSVTLQNVNAGSLAASNFHFS